MNVNIIKIIVPITSEREDAMRLSDQMYDSDEDRLSKLIPYL